MRKGITPIIAIIVLLLITVALAGTAWTYLSGYMNTLTGYSYEVSDRFCTGTTTAVIMLRNSGTLSIDTSELIVIDSSTGNTVAGSGWTAADGSALTGGMLPSGDIGRWDDGGICGTSCSYRISGAGARYSSTATVYC